MHSSKSERLRELAERIEKIESRQRRVLTARLATGIAALDCLIPQGGLARGDLVELLAACQGSGAWTLGMMMAAHVCSKRKALVVIDAEQQLYFPAAIRLGLELDRSIVVRPGSRRDAYQAMVRSLRSSAVGAVLGWQERLSMRELCRLQLAAESGGGVAILLRPGVACRAPSCAAVRWLVSPVAAHAVVPQQHGIPSLHFHSAVRERVRSDRVRQVRVSMVRCRGRAGGESLILEIDDETGHVHSLAAVASATVVARSARASG